MANRFISLPYKLNERLKCEKNASGLIVELLTDYYEKRISQEQEEIKRLEEELEIKKTAYFQSINTKKLEQEKTDELEKHKEFKRKQAEELRNSILEEMKRQEEKETNIN